MFKPGGASLNQRSEFFTHCRHYRKFLLCPPPKEKRKKKSAPPRWKQNLQHIYTFYTYLFLFIGITQKRFILVVSLYLISMFCTHMFFYFCIIAEDCHVKVTWNIKCTIYRSKCNLSGILFYYITCSHSKILGYLFIWIELNDAELNHMKWQSINYWQTSCTLIVQPAMCNCCWMKF